MLLERVPPFTSLVSSSASSSHHHYQSSGERRCHLFMWPCQYPLIIYTHILLYHVLIKQIIPPLPPLLFSSLCSSWPNGGVIDLYLQSWCLSACCYYPLIIPLICSPSSSLLSNDFLLPLASFPLSCSALHKSTRSLDPSRANEHHPFPLLLCPFFFLLPVSVCSIFFCLSHPHILLQTIHAVLWPCLHTNLLVWLL